MKRLERLTAIALFLGTRRRVLARDVAEAFGVSLRTVYRDVRALERAGFPIEGTAGDGYRVAQAAYLRPLALTPDEAEALTLAAYELGVSGGAPLREALARATTKLEATLDPPARRRLLELRRRIVVPPFARRATGPSAEILEALRERRLVSIAYDDPRRRQRTERDIEPLGLVCLGEAWWLVAYCRLRADARAFRLDRIESWQRREVRCEPRAGFSFAEVVARDQHLAESLFVC